MTDKPVAPETAEQALTPAPAAKRAPRLCPECGKEVQAPAKGPGQHKKFCDTACRVAFANREKAQGAVLVSIAKVWRRKRGSGDLAKAAFAEMNSILDLLNEQDRKEGRPSLDDYVASLIREPYMDRVRRR